MTGMTAEEGAWVREHVLTSGLRVIRSLCRCTEPAALCFYCAGGPTSPRHGIGDGVEITSETWLYNIAGNPWGAGTRQPTICVWLADRTCRRVCPCGCHATEYEPPPAPEPVDLSQFEAVPLFDLAGAP